MKRALLILFLISFKFFSQENVEMPIFPNCEKNENLKKCFRYSIAMHLVKNTNYALANNEDYDLYSDNIEETDNSKTLKTEIVNCFFTINYRGKTKKVKIQGNIKKEVLKKFKANLKRLPTMKPGTLNGEPISTPFVLPVLVVEN